VNPEVAASFAGYARDPEVILRERRRAAEAIVAIKRLLPPDETV